MKEEKLYKESLNRCNIEKQDRKRKKREMSEMEKEGEDEEVEEHRVSPLFHRHEIGERAGNERESERERATTSLTKR